MKPILYQLLPRTFSNYNETRKKDGSREENGCGTFEGITPKALQSIAEMGITHVWYTGIIRHATAERNNSSITKGKAGSPYAITDYYDVDPDLATNEGNRMKEFEALIVRTHEAGMKVVIDFIPNHVSREYHSLCKPEGVKDLGETDHPEWAFSPLNNFYYIPGEEFAPTFPIENYKEYPAKVTGNDCFTSHPGRNDWYETIKLNYGVHYMGGCEKQFSPIPDTWKKMLDILLYWAGKGVDAFRVDMAEMVPLEFWQWLFPQVRNLFPHLQFIGETYNPHTYRDFLNAGFDYLYDKVGMYEYLRGVTSRNYPAEGISQQWQAVGDIQSKMLYFLENHDEQRIASGFFCGRGMCAEPAMTVSALLGTNPVLIYAGQELGEKGMDVEGYSGMDGRSSIFDYWGLRTIQAWANHGKFDGKMLDEEQKNLRSFYCQLLKIAKTEKAIVEGQMYDLTYAQREGFNKHEHFAFLRKAGKDVILVISNFNDKQQEITVTIPRNAFEYLQQEEWKQAKATNLLTKEKIASFPFTSKDAIQITIPAWKSAVLKIQKATTKTTKK